MTTYIVSGVDRADVPFTRTIEATSTHEAMTILERSGVDYVVAEVCDTNGAQLAVYDDPSADDDIAVNGWKVTP